MVSLKWKKSPQIKLLGADKYGRNFRSRSYKSLNYKSSPIYTNSPRGSKMSNSTYAKNYGKQYFNKNKRQECAFFSDPEGYQFLVARACNLKTDGKIANTLHRVTRFVPPDEDVTAPKNRLKNTVSIEQHNRFINSSLIKKIKRTCGKMRNPPGCFKRKPKSPKKKSSHRRSSMKKSGHKKSSHK